MGDNTSLGKIIFRKISNFLLGYPEFVFLLKILGGAALVGIAYFVIKALLPQ